jgi:hypothetical protein
VKGGPKTGSRRQGYFTDNSIVAMKDIWVVLIFTQADIWTSWVLKYFQKVKKQSIFTGLSFCNLWQGPDAEHVGLHFLGKTHQKNNKKKWSFTGRGDTDWHCVVASIQKADYVLKRELLNSHLSS